jgi:hypothetical protein
MPLFGTSLPMADCCSRTRASEVRNWFASPASAPERNVSVLGFGTWGAISSDGKAIAFTESGHGIPEDYLVFFRRLDGSNLPCCRRARPRANVITV